MAMPLHFHASFVTWLCIARVYYNERKSFLEALFWCKIKSYIEYALHFHDAQVMVNLVVRMVYHRESDRYYCHN